MTYNPFYDPYMEQLIYSFVPTYILGIVRQVHKSSKCLPPYVDTRGITTIRLIQWAIENGCDDDIDAPSTRFKYVDPTELTVQNIRSLTSFSMVKYERKAYMYWNQVISEQILYRALEYMYYADICIDRYIHAHTIQCIIRLATHNGYKATYHQSKRRIRISWKDTTAIESDTYPSSSDSEDSSSSHPSF
jgi:hypothetical protein